MMEANGLYPKIARIMGRLNRLPKTGHNKYFNYDFVTDADVADTIRHELAAENIAFFVSMTEWQQTEKKTDKGMTVHTTATFEFTFMCGDTGQSKVCNWTGEADDGQDKGLSKAATSAEKYFLLKTFMLSTGDTTDDPDSGGSEQNDQKPAQTRKTASKTRVSQPAPSSTPANGNGAQNGKDVPTDKVKILAAETFPFEEAWKSKDWQTLIEKANNWNTVFWAAVKSLKVENDELHKAVNVESVNDYKGKAGNLWLDVCKLAIAKQEN